MNKQLQMSVYRNDADRLGDFPLDEEVLRRLFHHAHAPGATVTRAWMGFGRHALVHRRGCLAFPAAIRSPLSPSMSRTKSGPLQA